MSTAGGLPGLPGSAADPGEGPAEPGVLDGLLDDGLLDGGLLDGGLLDGGRDRPGPADAVPVHRTAATGDLRDLVGALVVPADRAPALPAALTAADVGLRVLLATAEPDPVAALAALEAARGALWDCDVEIVGRRLAFPLPVADPAASARALLPVLDAAAPTWIAVPPDVPDDVLDVLSADGAEHVSVDLTAGDPPSLARLLRVLVDRDLTFRAAGAPGPVTAPAPGAGDATGRVVPGALNTLCAVRAALNGAEPAELAEILAATGAAVLVSAVRRMSAADGAVARAFLVAAEVPDAGAAARELVRLGLFDADLP